MSGTISKLLGVSSFNQKTTFSDSDLDLLEATLRRSAPKSSLKPVDGFQLMELFSAEVEDRLSISSSPEQLPPASKIISSVVAPEGATLVSSRNSDGRLQMRIEYTREQLLDCAKSPLAILPPASIKDMVLGMPEILAPFPIRHGYTEDDNKREQKP